MGLARVPKPEGQVAFWKRLYRVDTRRCHCGALRLPGRVEVLFAGGGSLERPERLLRTRSWVQSLGSGGENLSPLFSAGLWLQCVDKE